MVILCTFRGAEDKTGTVRFDILQNGFIKGNATIEMKASRCLIRRIRENRDKIFSINPSNNKMAIHGAR